MTPYPTIDRLLAEASATTGLTDFGPPTFREGLGVLLDSFARDTGFDDAAAERALAVVRRRLVNRLEIEAWYRTHPEVADEVLAPPVSIMGLPRTGTTVLGAMLSLDDQFRRLRMWEQARPCPPPVAAEEPTDPRRLAMEAEMAAMFRDTPELAAMHLLDLEASAEDTEVLGLEFKAQQFTNPVRSYHDWWRWCDMVPAYAYHRRVVQLLQSRRPPNRWLFKCPHHKFHLEAIVAAYPDIRFVMTHRDPARSVPSYASLTSALYPPGSTAASDPIAWGRHTANHLREGMELAMAARDRLGEDRFHDVHHGEFVRDPLGTVERIYAFLGLELRGPVRAAMAAWYEANRAGTRGVHAYTPEQFGLDTAGLRHDFAAYLERFDVRRS